MDIAIQMSGPILRVTLDGELDHHRAGDVRDKVDGALERGNCRHVLMDLTRVTFMDSSGVGMIIGRFKNAEKRGGRLAIAGMGREMRRLYALSGLGKIIREYATAEEAARALGEE